MKEPNLTVVITAATAAARPRCLRGSKDPRSPALVYTFRVKQRFKQQGKNSKCSARVLKLSLCGLHVSMQIHI